MDRSQALFLWGNFSLQKQIIAFNRFQKIRYISKHLNVDEVSAEKLMSCSSIRQPQFYDFSHLLCRLLFLPDSVLARICLFIGASHFAREISASVLTPAGRELRQQTGQEVLAYSSSEGRLLLSNKRSSADHVRIEDLNLDILAAAGACYLRDLNIASVYGTGEVADELNESWRSRIHNLRTSSYPCCQDSSQFDITAKCVCSDKSYAVSDDSLSALFRPVAAGDSVIAGMVSKIMQKYEEETWKAFFI